jgi:DNA-directed RNA polymerase subunit RPC12/RpoP
MNDQPFCPHCGSTRLVGTVACATCGRSFEPVAESLEPAGAPASGWTQPASAGAMAVTSWRGLWVGAFIALVVPTYYLVLARLVEVGIVSSDQVHTLVHSLDTILFPWGVLLGPIGVVVAGRSAGIRGVFGWFVLMFVAVPALASLWLFSVLVYSGATGRPF